MSLEWSMLCVDRYALIAEVGTSARIPLLRYSASSELRKKQRYSGVISLAD